MKKKWIAVIVIAVLLIVATVVAAVLLSGEGEAPGDSEKVLTFAEFLAMSPADQQAYMESYENITDFLEWYRMAEEQYKAEQPNIEIGGNGDINIGDYIN